MTETDNSMYAIQMVLVIRRLQKSDFGGYKCISKNSIGGIEATIRLYGKCSSIVDGGWSWMVVLVFGDTMGYQPHYPLFIYIQPRSPRT